MKFKITTSAVGTLNPAGISSVFNSVQDTVSGYSLPNSRNWWIQNAVKLTTDTSERKAITGVCERYVEGGTGIATAAATAYTCCMPVVTSIVESDKTIPLCFMNGGYQLALTLNPALTVVSTGTYFISELEIVAAFIQPSNDWMQLVSKGLQGGEH
jgi:hypothetical protein